MSEPARKLKFADEDAVAAEVDRLRRGGYVRRGSWNLAQIAWHVGRPLAMFLGAPPPAPAQQRTSEQEERKRRFVDHIIATGTPPPGTSNAPPTMVPPDQTGEGEIDAYLALLAKLKAYPHERITMGPIGPVTIAEFRACNLYHAAHHLAFLEPRPQPPVRRQGLRYPDEDAIVDDIRTLRRAGYAPAGKWTLNQICWHLDATTRARMTPGPFPADTPEQLARRAAKQLVLATGTLPPGIPMPEAFAPPPVAGDDAVDACVATLQQFKGYDKPFAPHRLFGNWSSPDEARQLNRIHCANHLSYLVPNG